MTFLIPFKINAELPPVTWSLKMAPDLPLTVQPMKLACVSQQALGLKDLNSEIKRF